MPIKRKIRSIKDRLHNNKTPEKGIKGVKVVRVTSPRTRNREVYIASDNNDSNVGISGRESAVVNDNDNRVNYTIINPTIGDKRGRRKTHAVNHELHNTVGETIRLLNMYKDVCTIFYLEALNYPTDGQYSLLIGCIKNALDSIQVCNLCLYFIHNHSSHLKCSIKFARSVLETTIYQCVNTKTTPELTQTLKKSVSIAIELDKCLEKLFNSF